MNQLTNLVNSLSVRQRISILLVATVVVAGVVSFSHWRRESDFRPLYGSLAAEDAGAVVQKLKESGVEYRLADNGATVLVASARVAESRLALASAGLPKSGRIGFELFDKTNLGATEFAEHINYHRALEGELERSVMCLGEVEQARVHVTFPKESLYTEERQPAKASVLVRLKPGARISPANVTAISYLVSSAVEGLAPDAISVLDMQGNLLSRPRRPGNPGEEPSDALLDFRHSIERDLLNKINATLEPLVGADKFRAGVSVDCDFSSIEQSEEILDPSRSVMVSSQKSEDISGGTGASGVPGTASNLPRPTSRPGTMLAGVSRRTENIAYQSTRTVRHTRLPQGTIRKLSLAVLVDQAVRWEGEGAKRKRVLVPPSPETLKAIHDLVAGVAGFTPDRGDQLIVETLPFETTLHPETDLTAPPAPPPSANGPLPRWLEALRDPKIAAAAAGGVVVLIVVAFLALRGGKHKASASSPPALESAEAQPSLEERMQAQLDEQALLEQKLEQEALRSIKMPKVTSKKADVLAKQIKESAKKDSAAGAHVLREWIGEQMPKKSAY
ncbi:MAG TPA: flagellar basal-body MS-ring/collar protein FliF [Candidatus Binatia bacterium]|nr:flagellar basal-body MS-ring/collar protein FliF [Candidatus Binatia bacterium]